MDEHDRLAEQFEVYRPHLRAVAYRMLGSLSEADDAVQEAWLRLSRADTSGVANLGRWLTTVVARVCLDLLRSRESRRGEPLDARRLSEPITSREGEIDPEQEALMADAVELVGPHSNVELLWASPREILNVCQAASIGCDIITVTHDLLPKLKGLGRDLEEVSLETIKMFHRDAEAAGYVL